MTVYSRKIFEALYSMTFLPAFSRSIFCAVLPAVKGEYDPNHHPYKRMVHAGNWVDIHPEDTEIQYLGTKNSCFNMEVK